jgi:hypothetical protein
MSRTTNELAKAKNRMNFAALALKADRQNVKKQIALAEAIDDLERDRNTLQGAILKALACPAASTTGTPQRDLPGAVAKSLSERYKAVTKVRAAGEDAGQSKVNDGFTAKPKRLNMEYPDRAKKDVFR